MIDKILPELKEKANYILEFLNQDIFNDSESSFSLIDYNFDQIKGKINSFNFIFLFFKKSNMSNSKLYCNNYKIMHITCKQISIYQILFIKQLKIMNNFIKFGIRGKICKIFKTLSYI